jgi:guanylate kinase
MYRILGFVGPSGCGKDTATQYIGNTEGFHVVTLCTTRPKRDTEKGNEYHFLDPSAFLTKVLNGDMLNAQEFRGWYYGVSKKDLSEDSINVMAMSNLMVDQMMEEKCSEIELMLVYIDAPEKDRLMNILQREKDPDCAEVCRRFLTDEKDYTLNARLKNSCRYIISNNYTDDFFNSIMLIKNLYS